MKLISVLLEITWSCWLPMVLWMLGAFILGWMLSRWFGDNAGLDLMKQENNNLKATHESVLVHFQSRLNLLEAKNNSLQRDYEISSAQSSKLKGTMSKLEEVTAALNIANNKPPVKIVENTTRVDLLQAENDELKRQLKIEKNIPATEAAIAKPASLPLMPSLPDKDFRLISSSFGKKIVADDLKLVEGIGPKIEELFHKAGLTSWLSVAKSDSSKLKEILAAGGERFQMTDPTTWPKQCQMMVDDKWEELKAYQDRLEGGRETE